jgi:hypothetical protein
MDHKPTQLIFEVKLNMKHMLRILYALMINKPLLVGIPST